MLYTTPLTDLTIASGDKESAQMHARGNYERAKSITIFAPATLGEGETISIEVCDRDNGTQVWRTLGSLTVAEGGALTIENPSWMAFRIASAAAVAADRVFNINIQ